MSKLEKMTLQGVRAFSPKEKNVIVFNTPLTLIVGANGTGKTTMIECLKYATTGSLPPNSKNGNFIYDPAVAGNFDSKAVVKLKFTANNGKAMECTRAMQATNKQGKLTQKTLDCTLTTVEGNEINTLSTKLASIDAELCEYLGTTAALLESVIFCHQEESTWPISDPKTIKDRLDLIFSSTRFNKALKGLKEAKKHSAAQLKLKNQEYEFLFKEKGRRDMLLRDIEALENTCSSKYRQLGQIKEENARISGIYEQLNNEHSIFLKLEQNYKILKVEQESVKRSIIEFKNSNIGVIEGNLEELKAETKEKLESPKLTLKDIEIIEQDSRNALKTKKKLTEIRDSSMAAEKIKQENKKLANTIQQITNGFISSISHDIGIYTQASENVLVLQNTLQESLAKYLRDLNNEKSLFKKEQDAFLIEENKISETYVKAERYQEMYGELVADTSIDLDEKIEMDIEEMVDVEEELDTLVEEQIDKQEQLNVLFKNSENYFKKETIVENIRRIEEKLDIGLKAIEKKNELKNSIEEIKRRLELAREQKQSVLLEQTKINSAVKDAFMSLKNSYQQQAKDRASNSHINEKLISALDYIKPFIHHDISSNSPSYVKCMAKYEKILAPLQFDLENETVQATEQLNLELRETEQLIAANSNAISLYKELCKTGVRAEECALCETKLNDGLMERYIMRIERHIADLPEELSKCRQKKETLVNLIKQNQAKETSNLFKEKIKADLNALAELVSAEIKAELKIISENSHCIDSISFSLSTFFESKANRLSAELSTATAAYNEILFTENSNRDLKKELQQLRESEVKCADYSELETIKDELKHIKIKIDAKREELNRFSGEIKSREKRNKAKMEEISKRALIAERDLAVNEAKCLKLNEEQRESKRTELNSKESYFNTKYNDFMRNKIEIEMALESLKSNLKALSNKNTHVLSNDEFEEITQMINDLHSRYDAKSQLDSKVYVNPDSLWDGSLLNALCICCDKIEEEKQLYYKNRIVIDNLSKYLEEICKNMKYRENLKNYLKISEELKQLNMEQHAQVKERLDAIKIEKDGMSARESGLQGEIKQLKLTVAKQQNELETNYSDTLKRYTKCFVDTRCYELSTDDLDKCIAGLEKAIILFHQSKIDEVNWSLKELWSKTYKGTDIEYIALKATVGETKSYNYSLVMYKNSVEMEMRGRCSAGQKMIASILFRLALADSFSCSSISSCDVLALDEPTTNLDKENIHALAVTLSELIKDRPNIQLIVITHDEEFVDLLSREGLDFYYRLKRDSRGNSVVERQSVFSTY
ncbi:DNA repair protein RAD50 [Enteropsectra breve]|nr:DNA repair protein RAD50 [Enteropsectra breve]